MYKSHESTSARACTLVSVIRYMYDYLLIGHVGHCENTLSSDTYLVILQIIIIKYSMVQSRLFLHAYSWV